MGTTKPRFFPRPEDLREWLATHHARASELWVGLYKRATGTPSLTWSEAVDQALCFGWIDGVRKSLDARSYAIRFTPRKSSSRWSQVNLEKFEALRAAGQLTPSGLAAWASRPRAPTAIAYEQRDQAQLSAEELEQFRAHPAAWADFEARPPGYRRLALFFVVSAKQPATRARRLARLIADSAQGLAIKELRKTRPKPTPD